MKLSSYISSGALALALALMPGQIQASDWSHYSGWRDPGGAVFTMDNSATGNHVLAYLRTPTGKLLPDGTFKTGGLGSGNGLGNQGGLVLSENGRWLFVCNAGSDEITVFLVTKHGLVRTHKVDCQGKRPISLALHRNLLFVLNAGGQAGDKDGIAGFFFFAGRLYPLPNSKHALSADNTAPAQISFSPNGEVLVVTEKATGILDTFTVDNDGSIDDYKQFPSVGQTPFGFAFRRDDLIVSEAFGGAPDGSALSSYDVDNDGELEVISPSVPTTETAACWVVITGNGRYAYTSNAGSGSISGYRIAHDGSISLLDADGVTGDTGPGSGPIDMALAGGSRFLYSLNGGNQTLGAFRVKADGSLEAIPGISGLPAGANGLAAK